MGWLRTLFAKFGPSSDRDAAEQILNELIGTQIGPTGRSVEDLLTEGWNARRREQPEIAHRRFIAAAAVARESGDARSLGRAMVALSDNALHFFPMETADVFEVRAILAQSAKEILSSVHDDQWVAKALRVQASIAPGDTGRKLLEESLQMSRRIGDAEGVLSAMDRLGCHLALFGDRAEATSLKRKALEMARVLGDQLRVADCLHSLCIGFEGNPGEHRAMLEEAAMLYGMLGLKDSQASCFLEYAQLACEETEYERRKDYLERAAQLTREAGNLSRYGICLCILIDLCRQPGLKSQVESLEQEQKLLPDDGFSVEMAETLEQAFSSNDPETMMSTVRQVLTHGTDKK